MATQSKFTKLQKPKDLDELYEQFKSLADEFNKFIDFNKLADSGVTTDKIKDSAITSAKIADDAITDAKLRESAGLSVIGRSANSTGNPADITAGSDGQVLRRSGTTLGFGTVAAAGIASDAVTTAKILNANVTFAKLDAAPVVSASSTTVNLTGGLIDATEESAMEATLTIPTTWSGYVVYLAASFRVIDSGATTTRLNFRFRRGSGTAGTAIYAMTNCDYDSAAANDVVSKSLQFMDTGLTATGSVTYTLTVSDSDNDDVKTMDVGSFTLIAIRTS